MIPPCMRGRTRRFTVAEQERDASPAMVWKPLVIYSGLSYILHIQVGISTDRGGVYARRHQTTQGKRGEKTPRQAAKIGHYRRYAAGAMARDPVRQGCPVGRLGRPRHYA